nr:MAG TPA: hypothetical protein [Caudoviricetes sp.]
MTQKFRLCGGFDRTRENRGGQKENGKSVCYNSLKIDVWITKADRRAAEIEKKPDKFRTKFTEISDTMIMWKEHTGGSTVSHFPLSELRRNAAVLSQARADRALSSRLSPPRWQAAA